MANGKNPSIAASLKAFTKSVDMESNQDASVQVLLSTNTTIENVVLSTNSTIQNLGEQVVRHGEGMVQGVAIQGSNVARGYDALNNNINLAGNLLGNQQIANNAIPAALDNEDVVSEPVLEFEQASVKDDAEETDNQSVQSVAPCTDCGNPAGQCLIISNHRYENISNEYFEGDREYKGEVMNGDWKSVMSKLGPIQESLGKNYLKRQSIDNGLFCRDAINQALATYTSPTKPFENHPDVRRRQQWGTLWLTRCIYLHADRCCRQSWYESPEEAVRVFEDVAFAFFGVVVQITIRYPYRRIRQLEAHNAYLDQDNHLLEHRVIEQGNTISELQDEVRKLEETNRRLSRRPRVRNGNTRNGNARNGNGRNGNARNGSGRSRDTSTGHHGGVRRPSDDSMHADGPPPRRRRR